MTKAIISPAPPALRHFRLEIEDDGIAHLIFDMGGSPVNILSQETISEIGAVAGWFETADVRAIIIRSAKQVFCAGGDLDELGTAYHRISALPVAERTAAARAQFGAMSAHLLRLERCGKPVAAAIGGLALGGGCELALAAHYRVLADTPAAALGLPEVPIGLIPGAGGTQRLPRLIGVEAAMPLLLEGSNLSSRRALDTGIVDALVAPGMEVEAARTWVRAHSSASQPWDRPGWALPDAASWRATVATAKSEMFEATGGNYPAQLAIFRCLEEGLDKPMGEALAIELDEFAALIQRPEPRNMIRALFIGAQDYGRRRKAGTLPPGVEAMDGTLRGALAAARADLMASGVPVATINEVAARLGFAPSSPVTGPTGPASPGSDLAGGADYWFEQAGECEKSRIARILMNSAAGAWTGLHDVLPERDHALVDYLAIRKHGFPAWSGGPIAWLDRLSSSAMTPAHVEVL